MVDLNVLPFACVVQLWGRPRVDFWRIPWPFQHFHPCDTLCVPPRAIEGRVVQRAIEGVDSVPISAQAFGTDVGVRRAVKLLPSTFAPTTMPTTMPSTIPQNTMSIAHKTFKTATATQAVKTTHTDDHDGRADGREADGREAEGDTEGEAHGEAKGETEGEVDGRSRRAKRSNDQMEKPTAAESTEKPKEKPKETSKVEKPTVGKCAEKGTEKRTEKRRRHPAYMPRKTWYDVTRQSIHTATGEIVWVFNGEGMGAKENLNPPRCHVVAGCSRLSHDVASAIHFNHGF